MIDSADTPDGLRRAALAHRHETSNMFDSADTPDGLRRAASAHGHETFNMIDSPTIQQLASASRRRPGPFGPAWALLPKDQQPLVIDDDLPAYDAIERMVDSNFSQLPIRNGDSRIIGVFTWRSFGKRAGDLRKASIKAVDLPVREAMEPARFIEPEIYIDTETDWGDIDYVLVGDDRHLHGVLCVADVFGRLNDFAEAFVLLYEIEHEIRDLIHDVYTERELTDVLDAMMSSATREVRHVAEELKKVLDEKGTIPAVGKAIRLLRTGLGSRSLERLEDFTFAQYRTLICCEDNWPRFQPLFATMRELVDADFGEINELRNIVFHFRRGITPKDTDRLRRFRDRLRYDRELSAKRAAPIRQ
ncbi:MAG: CBS domain-containing protein [Candidatus Binataceae bacterium]